MYMEDGINGWLDCDNVEIRLTAIFAAAKRPYLTGDNNGTQITLMKIETLSQSYIKCNPMYRVFFICDYPLDPREKKI